MRVFFPALALVFTSALFTSARCASALFAGDDWPAWRGPTGDGVAASGPTAPTRFDSATNVLWKADVPGRGHSSPIVLGERVYLTSFEEDDRAQTVLALDRKTGAAVGRVAPHAGKSLPKLHPKNTHATPTLAAAGERLFAVFCNDDTVHLTALNPQGKTLWQARAGGYAPKAYQYGYAPSPALYKSLVIVASEYEAGYLAAFDQATGKEAWRAARPRMVSYSTPVVAHVAGRDQLLLSGCDLISSYDPASGKPLWSCPAIAAATCGTMVWEGDVVFASGGYPKQETAAVLADGSGKVLWRNKVKCYEQSMLVHAGHVYAVDDGGVAYCWEARSGAEKWRQRLAGPISASPLLVGDAIYQANERGKVFVFRAAPEKFELLAENQLGDECFASPAACGGRMYWRVAATRGGKRQETVYCVGTK